MKFKYTSVITDPQLKEMIKIHGEDELFEFLKTKEFDFHKWEWDVEEHVYKRVYCFKYKKDLIEFIMRFM